VVQRPFAQIKATKKGGEQSACPPRDPAKELVIVRNPNRLPLATARVHVAIATPFACSVGAAGRPRSKIAPLSLFRRVAAFIRRSRARSRSRQELLALDDRMLKDIGLTRTDALYEAMKPFWR
jgi:uncharacterized protein YjiS (DUF1127 family)